MEDGPLPGVSVLELVCSVLTGSTACAGSQVDAASCDQVPAAYVYTLRAKEDAERAALEQALAVVVQRLQGPDLCSLEAALNEDGTMALRIVSAAEEAPFDASVLAPGVLDFYVVDETRGPTEIAPGYAVFPDRTGAPVMVKWESLLPPNPVSAADAHEGDFGWVVSVTLTPEATVAFANVTASLVQRPLAITVDDIVMMWPRIQEPITGGAFVISGDFAAAEAMALAVILRGGRLPDGVTLEIASVGTEVRPSR